MLIRVYEYGCWTEPVRGLQEAIEQMFRRNLLWNRLVEIDSEIRDKMDAVLSAGAQEEKLAALRQYLFHLRRKLLNGVGPHDLERKRVAKLLESARTDIRSTLTEVKRIRKENATRNRAILREFDDSRKGLIRKADDGIGLYWANRTEVRRRYEVARARAIRTGRRLQKQPWTGSGSVCIHFQKELPVSDAFRQNGRLQIEQVPEEAWSSPKRSIRRQLARTTVRIRVAANADRTPVWLELPVVIHRPLPGNGAIRSVSVMREKIGTEWRYRLLLTVREPAAQYDRGIAQSVGVDVGWRVITEGLRVAYWYGSGGTHGDLVLSVRDIAAFRQIDGLQSTITSIHEEAKTCLGSNAFITAAPEALRKQISKAVNSASPANLIQLTEVWKTNRFPGDDAVFDTLRKWHKQHIHLWTWQANLRDQVIKRRRELYRGFAADLTRRFGMVFLNDVQLSRKSARPRIEWDPVPPARRQNRFIGAISVLARILEHTCEKAGVRFFRIRCPGATMNCHSCQWSEAWDPTENLSHRCSNCGEQWDQDYNAAANVLKQGLSMSLKTDAGLPENP